MSTRDRTLGGIVVQMQTAHVICRDLTHAWEPYTVEAQRGGFKRVIRCPRCDTRRTDILDRRGKILRRSYAYPDHYLVNGVGRLIGDTKNTMRLEALKRLLERES